MAVYEQNKRKALEEAAREQAAFAQAKKSYAQQLIERMNAKVDQAAGEAVAEKQAQLEQADGRYRGKFDANAVQQLAQERQIAERLANLGLTGSGAQAAQETAAAEQRQRGDAVIRQEKAAYVTGLTDSIRQEQETAQEKKEQYRHAKYYRIGNLCFITFHMKETITSAGTGYARISGLPYTSASSLDGQGLAIRECSGGITCNATDTVAFIPDNSTYINIQNNYGSGASKWSTGDTWIGFTGCYWIQ